MPLTTYTGLLAAIPRWAMRAGDTEFETQVPDFVALAETRMGRDLRVAQMEARATLIADVNGAAPLPADYLEWRSVANGIRGQGEMEFAAPGAEIGNYPGGPARRFSIAGGVMQTYPAAPGPLDLAYYARVPALSASAPVNWLLTAAPDLYLYASLLEAAPYMEEDSRAAVWKTFYDKGLEDLRRADVGARYAAGRVRVRSATP